jgi:hypothetical protein
MYARLYANILKKMNFNFVYIIVGMHENLQKIMSKLMLNRIFNEWHGYYIIIPKFY